MSNAGWKVQIKSELSIVLQDIRKLTVDMTSYWQDNYIQNIC
jgi:hypothetical protein